MSILDSLYKKETWLEFLEHKKNSEFYWENEEKSLNEKEEYISVCDKIFSIERFPLPKLTKLNKKFSEKKRMVFIFGYKEKYVFKLLAYLLHKYDYLFNSNLFSFRQNISVQTALDSLIKQNNNNQLYSYKVDIHDYFNSVDTDTMVSILRKNITDDEK